MNRLRDSWPAVLACLIAAGATCGLAVAAWKVWSTQCDGDMLERFTEYSLFREGTYPNTVVERPPSGSQRVFTVYPPYALPMFAVFFEPGGMVQGRLLLQGLSLASLAVLGWYGRETLASYGSGVAALGAVLGLAVADNATAIRVGQLTIVCVGLIVLQMMLLDRGRGMAAGMCWALAMVKPHIALPFVTLFLLRRQTRGAVAGAMGLLLLSWFACWWTDVTPSAVLKSWGGRGSFRFLEDGYDVGPGAITKRTGLDRRIVVAAVAAGVAATGLTLVAVVRKRGEAAMLPLAAACSVLGMFACYHRHYDNIMLYPALVAATELAARTRRAVDVAIAAGLMASLAIPFWVLRSETSMDGVVAVAWLVGGFYPIVALLASRSDGRRAA
jgi:hypothetical protein